MRWEGGGGPGGVSGGTLCTFVTRSAAAGFATHAGRSLVLGTAACKADDGRGNMHGEGWVALLSESSATVVCHCRKEGWSKVGQLCKPRISCVHVVSMTPLCPQPPPHSPRLDPQV